MRLYLILLVSGFKFFGRSKTSSRVAEGVFLYFSEAGRLVLELDEVSLII